jgi:aspartate/glutamate racemase
MEFELRVHRAAQQLLPQHGNMGYPPTVVVYVRHPPFLVDESLRRVEPPQPDPRLFESARQLGTLADFLVITSNATHLFMPQIEAASGRKVLSMIDQVLDEVRRRHWKRVGVLGLGQPKIYMEPLRAAGIECDTIEPPLRDQLDRSIFLLMEGRDGPQTQAIARQAVDALRAADGIILGCTEIPPLLADPNLDADPRFINPLVLLADAAVRHAAGLQSRPLV